MISTLTLAASTGVRCDAQTTPSAPATVASLHDPASAETSHDGASNRSAAKAEPAPAPADPDISPAVAKQLATMQAEIEALKTELKSRDANASAPGAGPVAPAVTSVATKATEQSDSSASAGAQAGSGQTEKPEPAAPFAYADWTWLNGTARNKDAVWDSKFFTPEIRFDTNFVSSFNHPQDDTIGGSSEIFRSNEVQVEQISFGGDFHWQNVRGRVLTMGGMFGVTTPRNDASPGRGQWDLRGAYKYFSEAYGGYHFNVNHGLNVDAGIFVSYIG
ncbi:MAG TPA: outer membrane beta-barrel protein, partial [Terriglobales bacterium]|nr:outer membrane beta-barrel protein [Terriglobales bacterium]